MELIPVIDQKVLQEKVNEFAMKGAIESIKEFYTGYNSPYKKQIEEQLKKTDVGVGLQLPDIIALINDTLSKEIDALANTAVANSFAPMVKQLLTREKTEMNLSELLKEFIEITDSKSIDDVSMYLRKEEHYSWYRLELTSDSKKYELTLFEAFETRNKQNKQYTFLSMPGNRDHKNMKIAINDATIEMPFTTSVLHDRFISFIARLIICGTKINLDCDDFSEDMFPEQCHCH